MAQYRDMYDRLCAHVTVPADQCESTGCWEHDGPLSRPHVGYPRISVRLPGGKHAKKLAHILMFEQFYGPVPEGHEVDHQCHNHRCINPDHLQALPIYDNRAKNRKPRYL